MIEVTTENNLNMSFAPVDPEIEAMMKAGVHLGHAKSKNHPAMQPYIFGVRNTISLIDLTKTKQKLAEALEFLKDVASRGGLILFVGTRPAARKIILEIAENTKMPYVVERWIGGAFTNFKVISKRVQYMEKLESEKASGDFEKYTKKERMKKEEEIVRLRKIFDGLRAMKRLPDAMVVVDITHDTTAIHEAKTVKVPVIALVDTNSNIASVDYPIPSNDDALPAVRYMMERIRGAVEQGLKIAQEKKVTEEKKIEPA